MSFRTYCDSTPKRLMLDRIPQVILVQVSQAASPLGKLPFVVAWLRGLKRRSTCSGVGGHSGSIKRKQRAALMVRHIEDVPHNLVRHRIAAEASDVAALEMAL